MPDRLRRVKAMYGAEVQTLAASDGSGNVNLEIWNGQLAACWLTPDDVERLIRNLRFAAKGKRERKTNGG